MWNKMHDIKAVLQKKVKTAAITESNYRENNQTQYLIVQCLLMWCNVKVCYYSVFQKQSLCALLKRAL